MAARSIAAGVVAARLAPLPPAPAAETLVGRGAPRIFAAGAVARNQPVARIHRAAVRVEAQAFAAAAAAPARSAGVRVGVAGQLALGLRRRRRQCGLAHAVAPGGLDDRPKDRSRDA